MFRDFDTLINYSLSVTDITLALIAAMTCGLIIATLYKLTSRGPGFSVTFAHSLIALALITALIILVIGNNLARAFGLVGAMSIIRFRTAVKETYDIIFIFFALAVGLAAGAMYYGVAITGTIIISVILFFLAKVNLFQSGTKEFLLQIKISTHEKDPEAVYTSVFQNHLRAWRLLNSHSADKESTFELTFTITLHNEKKVLDFLKELKSKKELETVNLFRDEPVSLE
ncbi:MAG: DUF4956 domain-containing protein [Bacteroidetes bacterium]|nr:DUF4956 domain-containing protein [Bacteroidota bacterium]